MSFWVPAPRFHSLTSPHSAPNIPSPSTTILNTLLRSLSQRELISIDVAASLVSPDVHQQDLTPQALPEGCYSAQMAEQDQEGVREILGDLPTNYLAQKEISKGLQAVILLLRFSPAAVRAELIQ